MNADTKTTLKTLPAPYGQLVALHTPRPIHDEVGYQNTVEVIDAMAGHRLNPDQEDYLELLSRLVETYEAEASPEPKHASGVAALRFLLQENDLAGDDLAKILDVDRSVAFKVLKGNRRLTADHIRKLAARFHVSSDLFLKR